MNVWLLLALWIGTSAGFFLFALMAMARDGDRHESRTRGYAALRPRRTAN